MFKDTQAFSGFSVNDFKAAKAFYEGVLGLKLDDTPMGLWLRIKGTNGVFVYQKDNHEPATYTILNFPVDNIDKAVSELKAKGVKFEHYDSMTDDKDIARGLTTNMGPDIAWFKDPAGNILAVLQQA